MPKNIHKNNLYLVEDLLDQPKICAFRADKIIVGSSFNQLDIPDGDVEFLRSSLRSLCLAPVLLTVGTRPALVLTSFWGSSGICEIVTLEVDRASVLKMARRGMLGVIRTAPSFECVAERTRLHAYERRAVRESAEHIERVREGCAMVAEGECHFEALLSERFLNGAAEFVGARVERCGELPFGPLQNYDRSAMTAFLLLGLMTVRQSAKTRAGRIEFFKMTDGLAVSLEFEGVDGAERPFEVFSRLSERLGFYMSVERRGENLHFELCPRRPEVSLLGLKDGQLLL